MECDEGSEDTKQEKDIPCSSEKMSLLDISDYTDNEDISDDKKFALINNRHPPKGFKFQQGNQRTNVEQVVLSTDIVKRNGLHSLISYHIL